MYILSFLYYIKKNEMTVMKMKILSSFTDPQIVPNLYECKKMLF